MRQQGLPRAGGCGARLLKTFTGQLCFQVQTGVFDAHERQPDPYLQRRAAVLETYDGQPVALGREGVDATNRMVGDRVEKHSFSSLLKPVERVRTSLVDLPLAHLLIREGEINDELLL